MYHPNKYSHCVYMRQHMYICINLSTPTQWIQVAIRGRDNRITFMRAETTESLPSNTVLAQNTCVNISILAMYIQVAIGENESRTADQTQLFAQNTGSSIWIPTLYVQVAIGGKESRTTLSKHSSCPKWRETFTFDVREKRVLYLCKRALYFHKRALRLCISNILLAHNGMRLSRLM